MERGIEKLKREIGYNATRWSQMLAEHGGVGAAKRLLKGTDVSQGFVKLWSTTDSMRASSGTSCGSPASSTTTSGAIAYQRLRRYEAPVDDWLQDRLGRRRP